MGRETVDVPARRATARLMRRFAAGHMTVDEFEDQMDSILDATKDEAVYEASTFAWLFYDDFTTVTLTEYWKLEDRTSWAQFILYLMTNDQPFGAERIEISLVPWPISYIVDLIRRKPKPDPAAERRYPFASEEDFLRSKSISNPFAA